MGVAMYCYSLCVILMRVCAYIIAIIGRWATPDHRVLIGFAALKFWVGIRGLLLGVILYGLTAMGRVRQGKERD